MEPAAKSDDATVPVRGRGAAVPQPPRQAPEPARRPSSGVRVWPPRPEPSAPTVADFSLDSVRESEPLVEAILLEHLCPACQVKLIDPDGVGICPACGQCRSLREGVAQLAAVEAPAEPPKRWHLRAWERFPTIPSWVWGLGGGLLLILGTAMIASASFPHHCRERTVWSTYQLIFGLLTMIVAQWWVMLKLEPDLGQFGAMELFVLSGRLWGCAFQRMPLTLGPVYMGFWGLWIAVTAVTVTGGLADWLTPVPGGK